MSMAFFRNRIVWRVLTLVVAWGIYRGFVGPFYKQRSAIQSRTAQLRTESENAHREISQVRTLRETADQAKREFDFLQRDFPQDSALIWMPELLKKYFARFGVEASTILLNTKRPEPSIPGYSRCFWSLSLPVSEPDGSERILLAVADLEKTHSFFQLLDFGIQPDPQEPQRKLAGLNVSALVRD